MPHAKPDDLVASDATRTREKPGLPQEPTPGAGSGRPGNGIRIVQRLIRPALVNPPTPAQGAHRGYGRPGGVRQCAPIALKRVVPGQWPQGGQLSAVPQGQRRRFGLTPEQAGQYASAPCWRAVRQRPWTGPSSPAVANAATVAQMSPSEQARTDAARGTTWINHPDENGEFTTGTSRDFIRCLRAGCLRRNRLA